MDRPKAPFVIELPYPYELGWTYEVTKVDPGGTAQIVAVGPSPESEWDKAEQGAAWWGLRQGKAVVREPWVFGGPCLMLVKPLVDGGEPGLFRVEVHVVGVMEWTVELGEAGAAKVRPGDHCSLIQPLALTWDALRFHGRNRRSLQTFGRSEPELTRDELRAFPQVIPIVPATKEKPKAPESLQQARTLANLSAIGRAIHLWNGLPTFLVGPDGKPWHSWRVLLLPCLGHRDLFDEYDFSQPWDSAKNLRLLDKMPAVYHDPIYGNDLGHFTHYAALVGGGPGPNLAGATPTTGRIQTAFSPAGLPMKGATIWPLQRLTYSDVTKEADGELQVPPPRILNDLIPRPGMAHMGSRIMVAAVSPDRKIPWTKPEDITVGPEFPFQLGQPGGIAAPYTSGKAPHLHRAAPVLFEDGKSSAIVDTIDLAAFRAIVVVGEVERSSMVPMARFAEYRSPPFTKLLIDCDNHRATITGPELIEPGVYHGAAQIRAPLSVRARVDLRGHESRPRRDGPDREGRPFVGDEMAERRRSSTKSVPGRGETEAARRSGGVAHRGSSAHAGPAARRWRPAEAAPRRGRRRGRQGNDR